MSNEELLMTSADNAERATFLLRDAYQIGLRQPVPAERFTTVTLHLRKALAAATELERLARGGEPPVRG
jgi:hypothetical protein